MYNLNVVENVNFIYKNLDEISLSYISLVSNSQNVSPKDFNEVIAKLMMLICLITHTILNNAGNDRSIHYDSPTDEQTDTQGKILATCLKLIEFENNISYPDVSIIFLFF